MGEFLAPLERKLEQEVMKYAVQKQMFCPVTGNILDYRTCIAILVTSKAGDIISSSVVSPAVDEKLDKAKEVILKCFPDSVVIFSTLNKKLTNPLLIKI